MGWPGGGAGWHRLPLISEKTLQAGADYQANALVAFGLENLPATIHTGF